MAIFKTFKETALPSPSDLQPHAIYYINPTQYPDYVEIYVTDSLGIAKRLFGRQDVQTLFAEFKASQGQLSVVDTYAQVAQIQNPIVGSEVFVIDATGDTTVKSGGARYLWTGTKWLKISETESMDINFSYNGLTDKPNSSVQEIDNAVAVAHTHANKSQLDKISEDTEGNFTYGGKAVATQWSTTAW